MSNPWDGIARDFHLSHEFASEPEAPDHGDRKAALAAAAAGSQSIRYGDWTIHYDPPPIPIRTMDWQFVHEDYDASYEGEEDGWVSNGLNGSARTLSLAMDEIDEIEAERLK